MSLALQACGYCCSRLFRQSTGHCFCPRLDLNHDGWGYVSESLEELRLGYRFPARQNAAAAVQAALLGRCTEETDLLEILRGRHGHGQHARLQLPARRSGSAPVLSLGPRSSVPVLPNSFATVPWPQSRLCLLDQWHRGHRHHRLRHQHADVCILCAPAVWDGAVTKGSGSRHSSAAARIRVCAASAVEWAGHWRPREMPFPSAAESPVWWRLVGWVVEHPPHLRRDVVGLGCVSQVEMSAIRNQEEPGVVQAAAAQLDQEMRKGLCPEAVAAFPASASASAGQ